MTLVQLRYLIAVAQHSSVQKAAESLYVSQPSISKAIASLEDEMGITIFTRHSTGMTLTEEGYKFLTYAQQVIEQADLLLSHYRAGQKIRRVFSISSHHYAFVVNAFVLLLREYTKDEYEFSLRETRTFDIIEDVKTTRSEIGIIYLSPFNRDVIRNILKSKGLEYRSLFIAKPHVFVSRAHPIAAKQSVRLEDLREYPRFTYDQGTNNSFYFAEELHSNIIAPKSIVVTDRATLFNLLLGLQGYTIASGILSTDLNGDQIVAVPLESEEYMELIVLTIHGHKLSSLAARYIQILSDYVRQFITNSPNSAVELPHQSYEQL
ncbi:MAG: LysR family transcriptional regulator [Candidatus Anaerobiospirillum pullicola]|uniref:LysR family transcriptional regulator n=1 Tax=Candidatus Anaerobiospirillum pullicola TaxID=2838451 RepID=A0A948TGE1_9GAMM|nr:LysR family transcriptional regulator [Candidatus Anaerobiospirillum pullicola]